MGKYLDYEGLKTYNNKIKAKTDSLAAADAALAANVSSLQATDEDLQSQINNLKAIGRYLSGWDCTTGLATTTPPVTPYTYNSGDYFIVSKVGSSNNKKPSGTTYTGTASTATEPQIVKVNDYYRYDGTAWNLEINTQRSAEFQSITGRPRDNVELASEFDTINGDISAIANIANSAKSIAESKVSNVQSNWNATSGLAQILNKPSSLPASDVYSWAKQANKPTYTASEVGAIGADDVLMPTNPFGGKKLFINSIDNALFNSDKRYYVTVTKHYMTEDGVSYPKIDTSKTVDDDNYYIDGPIVSGTVNAHTLFDGFYESQIAIPVNQYLKVRIMFGANTSPSQTTSQFSGYPYGTFYLSYYYTNKPSIPTIYRVYSKFQVHGIGWHAYNASAYVSRTDNYIEQIQDSGNYGRTCIEFLIFGNSSGSTTVNVTQIDWKLSRPNLSQNGSTVTKYGTQELYEDFIWRQNHVETARIAANGTISAKNFNESGVLLSNKYASKDALNNKLDKVSAETTQQQIYGKLADGTQKMYNLSPSVAGSFIPLRDGAGQLNLPQTPTASSHAASKGYVDKNIPQIEYWG